MPKATTKNYASLESIGLTRTAVSCYESLFNDGAATATQLANRLGISRTTLYRSLRKLEIQGFVTSGKTVQPALFHAVKLSVALLRLAEYQRGLVRPLLEEQYEVMERRNPPRPRLSLGESSAQHRQS